MSQDLPDSGEPGLRPPVPGSLPRPQLWPSRAVQQPFTGREEDDAPQPTPTQRRGSWVAVALMVLGVVLVGVAVALVRWEPLVVGVLAGLVGIGLGLRSRVLEDVSVTDDPAGPG